MSGDVEEKTFHIGLMGHIDAGKTFIAKRLSEIISTAGLDKHSQSQARGITIDLGFTFFKLEDYMITLVDAPGHADLIQSVISCANIIDLAFLVIDAKQGIQIQTGEHLIILDLLKIPNIFVLINKIDLVDPQRIKQLEQQIAETLKTTKFTSSYKTFKVSAKENLGFDTLKSNLLEYIKNNPTKREENKELTFLIDHHFNKKGYGTILTGTTLTGEAKIGDSLYILPQNIRGKIKSIQRAKISVDKMIAGDRCGIAITDLKENEINRGSFATNDKTKFLEAQVIDVEIEVTKLFKAGCPFCQQITINHRENALNGRLFPFNFVEWNGSKIKEKFSPDPNEKSFRAILWLEKMDYFKVNDILLLSRMDFGPKSLRIMGLARVIEVLNPRVQIYKRNLKKGIVTNPNYSDKSVIVEGLVQSKKGAETIKNLIADPPFGRVIGSFGQKNKLEIEIHPSYRNEQEKSIFKGKEVTLTRYKPFALDYSRSYK